MKSNKNINLKEAPPGFTSGQMHEFLDRGLVVIENAISREDILRYLKALDRIQERYSQLSQRDLNIYKKSLNEDYSPAKEQNIDSFLHLEGIVGLDDDLEELIDHQRHIGFAYDIYGELTKLHLSEAFIRPDSNGCNPWHVDGPRTVPYSSFSSAIPLQIRIGYWLTDIPKASMGNVVIIPGSHRSPYFEGIDTGQSYKEEEVITLKSGSITIMNSSLWHRVDVNTSYVTRKNFYLGYCPSWVTSGDLVSRDHNWIARLPRERRIILRDYNHPYDYSKPPVTDFPLYLNRPKDPFPERFEYPESISFHRRKHPTFIEMFLKNEGK